MTMIEEINERLDFLTTNLNEGKVKDAMRYSLLSGGKRIRALLMLTVIKSYDIDYHPYIDFACAIEMIHTYSLIHDDLPCMDDDELRRGKPTCHIAFDEAIATLAGDALLTEAFNILSNPKNQIDASLQLELINILAKASGQCGMVYGQQQDLFYENHKAELDDLKNIHAYKTGCLIQAPLWMGALIANKDDVEIFKKIGLKIGQAFQIQDDILDVIGDEKKLGKKVGVDMQHSKTTYVSVLGLETAKMEVDHLFKEVLELVYHLKINHGLMIGIL